MCWLLPRSTIGFTPTLLCGPGPTKRCGSGSLSMLAEFLALFVSRNTRLVDGANLLRRASPMSTTYERPPLEELRHAASAIRGSWLWFVVLGVAMIVLGVIALGSLVIASLATAVAIGVLLLIGG